MSLSSSSTLKPLILRISFGLILPFLIEILVYIIYTGLRTQDFQYSFILVFVFFIVPILFLYLIGPKLIFRGGRVKRNIELNLRNNLERVFLRPRGFILQEKTVPITDMELQLTKKEREIIESKIKKKLIPEILKDAEGQYNQNFIDRCHTTRNERLLTYNESLFLFSFVTAILLFFNLILIIILSQRSIKLDFFELDKIDRTTNVMVFAIVFAVLLLCSIYLLYISARQLCKIIPKVLPIIYYEPEIEREKRISQIKSIAEFPISNLFIRRTQRELSGSIEEAKRKLLLSRLTETISWYYRDEMAKANAWKLYKEVLEETQISEETKEKIEQQFKFDPLMQLISSQILTSEEEQAIKADLDYVNDKIKKWDKIRNEEQTLSFLLIYRTLETIFRKALSNLVSETQEEDVNFIKLIDIFSNNKLINKEEASLLHEIRFKRNVLFHSPGKSMDLGKSTMEKLLSLINEIIERIDE